MPVWRWPTSAERVAGGMSVFADERLTPPQFVPRNRTTSPNVGEIALATSLFGVPSGPSDHYGCSDWRESVNCLKLMRLPASFSNTYLENLAKQSCPIQRGGGPSIKPLSAVWSILAPVATYPQDCLHRPCAPEDINSCSVYYPGQPGGTSYNGKIVSV